jgi:hypothetical protein
MMGRAVTRTKALGLPSRQRLLDPLRGERHGAQAHAGRIEDRIGEFR